MRRTELQRRTPLRQGEKGLTTRRPLQAKTELQRKAPLRLVSSRKLVEASTKAPPELAAIPPRPSSTFRKKGSGFKAASDAQREAVKDKRCVVCGATGCDPAHLTPRGGGWGGCDSPLCVIPLCRVHHQIFDGRLPAANEPVDLAPVLALPEFAPQRAHMATHLDFVTALQRLSGCKYAPVNETTLMGAPVRGPEGTAA